MPDDRTVLDHLLEGRDALQREVMRLTAAIEELDSVLGRIGSTVARSDAPANPSAVSTPTVAESVDAVAAAVAPVTGPVAAAAEPVNPPVEVESGQATVPSRPRAVRKAPAKKAARQRRPGATSAEPPKSIRVHVLEMLQAENRDFGLAEIIDRVHGAGIQAHDDAVRSITIKLMKDGRVERVGRGQYRLARRGSAARASAAVATAPRVTESAPEPSDVPAPQTLTPETRPVATPGVDTPAADTPPADTLTTETPPTDTLPTDTLPTDTLPTDTLQTDTLPTGPESTTFGPPESAEPAELAELAAPGAAAEPADEVGPEQADEAEPGPADPGFADRPAFDPTRFDGVGPRHSATPNDEAAERGSYAPSLNLGQPWNS